MALFHYLHVRAFVHETEDVEKVRTALRNVLQGAPVSILQTSAEGSHGNRILILDGEVKAGQTERKLFAALARDDPAGAARLVNELELRLDEHLSFHLRVDKQEAFLGKLRLSSSDDAVTVRGKLKVFPGKGLEPEDAKRALRDLLGGAPGHKADD